MSRCGCCLGPATCLELRVPFLLVLWTALDERVPEVGEGRRKDPKHEHPVALGLPCAASAASAVDAGSMGIAVLKSV